MIYLVPLILFISSVAVFIRAEMAFWRPRTPAIWNLWMFCLWFFGALSIPVGMLIVIALYIGVRQPERREYILDFIFPAPWKDRYGA